MRVELTVAAEQDVINSYLYGLTEFGLQQADKYETEMRLVLSLIGENPALAHERAEFDPPVRVHHTGKHYIVYCIQNERVLVLRIIRDEVDLGLLLS